MSLTAKMNDSVLIETMEAVQEICTTGHAIRARNKIRTRQPFASMDIVDPEGKYSYLPFCPDLVEVIKDECNVKTLFLRMESCVVEL